MVKNKGREPFRNVPIEEHNTAAWANIEMRKPLSNVAIPNETEVKNAKDWVDANEK